MSEKDLQRVYNYPIYPKDSKTYSVKGFINMNNGSQGGTHWTCFYIKDHKPFCFDSFGGQPDKFLLNQLTKPIFYLNYKIQDINSKLCGSYTFFI